MFLLRGSGVRDLIGEVGDGAKKFLIEGCHVLSLVAFLDVGRPLLVGEADCGLLGEVLSSGDPRSVGRLCELGGLLVGVVVDTIHGAKSG